MKYFLHEERCAGAKCLLKDICFFHSIPVLYAKNSIRNFIKQQGEKAVCTKFEPIPKK